MKVTLFWLPGPKIRKIVWGGVLGLLAGLILLTIAWATGLGHQESYFSGSNSMPVSTQNIEVQVGPADNSSLQGEDYFVNYRLEREKYRQETKEMLQALLNSSDSKNRASAQAQWLEISAKVQQEGEIENLLKIKGFKDVVVNISADGAHVIIYTEKLGTVEISLIQDIVQRVSHLRINQIVISTRF